MAPRAPRLYRAMLAFCRIVQACLGIRLVIEGSENLPTTDGGRPAGGWIAAGLPHRTWVDPFVTTLLLPREPRLVFFGDGRAIFRSRIRRWIFGRVGGVVPIWPGGGGRAFGGHVQSAMDTIGSGAVFMLFPEVGPAVPVGEARHLSPGFGYFALRSGAPIVPLVLGGTEEIFFGRRIVMRVLPPVSARELAGLGDGEPLPAPGSSAERLAAHAIATALHARTAPIVAELSRRNERQSNRPRIGRWLTHAFR